VLVFRIRKKTVNDKETGLLRAYCILYYKKLPIEFFDVSELSSLKNGNKKIQITEKPSVSNFNII
jgi:hypothetical protein